MSAYLFVHSKPVYCRHCTWNLFNFWYGFLLIFLLLLLETQVTNLEEQLEQFREELENKNEEVQQLHMQLEIQRKESTTHLQELEQENKLFKVTEKP